MQEKHAFDRGTLTREPDTFCALDPEKRTGCCLCALPRSALHGLAYAQPRTPVLWLRPDNASDPLSTTSNPRTTPPDLMLGARVCRGGRQCRRQGRGVWTWRCAGRWSPSKPPSPS
eukprot:304722-Rhodomonas_salina.1